jgi:hypothetical protein
VRLNFLLARLGKDLLHLLLDNCVLTLQLAQQKFITVQSGVLLVVIKLIYLLWLVAAVGEAVQQAWLAAEVVVDF